MLSTLTFCFSLLLLFMIAVSTYGGQGVVRIPLTRFTCSGKPMGYYADVETGCQVYHMCDGLGRQFSYSCPNTTLFQQRMLVCDHWYMVNCSKSEEHYDANLLIGQRDKPFVSDAEMRQRTPRPDILSVPPNNNYFDGLKEAESKYPVHLTNNIVGATDSFSDSNDLDHGKQQYRPPSNWSTGTGVRPIRPNQERPQQSHNNQERQDQDNLAGAASQEQNPTIRPTERPRQNSGRQPNNNFQPPNQDLSPPNGPTAPASAEMQIDARMKEEDPVVQFINRFDPNSPDPVKTSMTTEEIININRQLPQGQAASGEEERQSRGQKFNNNNVNSLNNERNKNVITQSRFNSVNEKPVTQSEVRPTEQTNLFAGIPTPETDLLPPNHETKNRPTTTVGPPIYYEWKWAVPAFDLELPKTSNITENENATSEVRDGRSPFRSVTRPTPSTIAVTPPNTEYNISSYFVPDYVFPLDDSHAAYDGQDARSSFQAEVASPGKSYGENPNCPHCHPAYLNPGTCEPCIVKR